MKPFENYVTIIFRIICVLKTNLKGIKNCRAMSKTFPFSLYFEQKVDIPFQPKNSLREIYGKVLFIIKY